MVSAFLYSGLWVSNESSVPLKRTGASFRLESISDLDSHVVHCYFKGLLCHVVTNTCNILGGLWIEGRKATGLLLMLGH